MAYSVWISYKEQKYRRIGGEYRSFEVASKVLMEHLLGAAPGDKVKLVATRLPN